MSGVPSSGPRWPQEVCWPPLEPTQPLSGATEAPCFFSTNCSFFSDSGLANSWVSKVYYSLAPWRPILESHVTYTETLMYPCYSELLLLCFCQQSETCVPLSTHFSPAHFKSPSLSGCFEVSVETCHLIIIPMVTSCAKTNKHRVKTSLQESSRWNNQAVREKTFI